MARRVVHEKHHHSNYEITFEGGKTSWEWGMPCYSVLWSGYYGMTELRLFFHKGKDEYKDYVNWLLNCDDLWAECFITKDYDEGMEDGFQINIDQPTNWLFSAMAALRFPYECENYHSFDWSTFVDWGYSEKEALFLTTNFYLNNGYLRGAHYNSNHIPIPRTTPLNKYHKDFFQKQKGTMRERSSSNGVSGCWPHGETISDQLVSRGVGNNGSWGDMSPTKLTDELKDKLKLYIEESR